MFLREKEFHELKECLFKPNLHKKIETKSVVEVKGINKFLYMKEKKKKIEQEKKEREEQVFAYEKKYDSSKHETFTSIKPFQLSKVFILYNKNFLIKYILGKSK